VSAQPNAPILLYGLGRSGLAAGRLVASQGHDVAWFDAREEGEDVRAAHDAGWSRVRDVEAVTPAVCIAAPGVAWNQPDLVALRARGVEVIGEIEWVGRTLPNPMIGITGTAGKGTVTRWTQTLLEAAGMDAAAGGNLDPALAALALPTPSEDRWFVVEVSSFQLERSPSLHPRVAVITRLGRDHIDRHGTLEAYHATKRRLLTHLEAGDIAILNADDPHQTAWRDTPATVWTYSAEGNREASARLEANRIVVHGQDLGSIDRLDPPGRHNQENLLAALLAAHATGAPLGAMIEAIPALRVAEGRHECIAERCGVRFVEDSVASRELAVSAALEAATPPIAWIVGGRDKGANLTLLTPRVKDRVAHVYGIGEAGPAFVQALTPFAPGTVIEEAEGERAMRRAVRRAAQLLHDQGGGTVLLAPLAASFDQFPGYQARGKAFRAVVHELLQEAPWTACS